MDPVAQWNQLILMVPKDRQDLLVQVDLLAHSLLKVLKDHVVQMAQLHQSFPLVQGALMDLYQNIMINDMKTEISQQSYEELDINVT